MDMKTFGKFARQRIRELGKSQKALAEELGVSPAYVSQIFSGKKSPPDLGRPRNRLQLRLWSVCLQASEEEILEVVRFELHRLPPPPEPRFRKMRDLLLMSLKSTEKGLRSEIRALELHPAEARAISALAKIYLVFLRRSDRWDAESEERFSESAMENLWDREFVEEALVGFFQHHPFQWTWDPLLNDVHVLSRSPALVDAVSYIRSLGRDRPGQLRTLVVPVVGEVSAGEGFVHPGKAFLMDHALDWVQLPLGVDSTEVRGLYCVRVKDDSLRELFGRGALLFVKIDSSEEIRDGDVVVFRASERAFVKRVEFAGDSLILKTKNPLHKDLVLRRSDMDLLERVVSVIF
ncbi:MAG: S24 family peptidase [Thermodesulfobacteriota bacterium]